jgi:hypothetical protein
MSNTQPDFLADEFLLDHYVGKNTSGAFAAFGKSYASNSISKIGR